MPLGFESLYGSRKELAQIQGAVNLGVKSPPFFGRGKPRGQKSPLSSRAVNLGFTRSRGRPGAHAGTSLIFLGCSESGAGGCAGGRSSLGAGADHARADARAD